MNNELMVQEFEPVVKSSGLDKAENYAAIFAPFMITLKELTNKSESINLENPSVVDAKLAREVRLAMVKNRTASEKEKDKNKATLLAEGNLIQNLYNIIANASKISEADMDAVEKYAENKEKERRNALAAERSLMFTEYGTDLTGYDLGGMADNVFADLLESQKLLHEKRIAEAARLEAERIAAEKAELERQAALKLENERLKAEADVAAKKLEETARLAKIESDRHAALLKVEQDKAAKAVKELQDKKDAEAKAESDRIAAEKKAAKAPDKQKIAAAIESLKWPEVLFTTDDGERVHNEIRSKFEAFKSWALQQVNSL